MGLPKLVYILLRTFHTIPYYSIKYLWILLHTLHTLACFCILLNSFPYSFLIRYHTLYIFLSFLTPILMHTFTYFYTLYTCHYWYLCTNVHTFVSLCIHLKHAMCHLHLHLYFHLCLFVHTRFHNHLITHTKIIGKASTHIVGLVNIFKKIYIIFFYISCFSLNLFDMTCSLLFSPNTYIKLFWKVSPWKFDLSSPLGENSKISG